MDLSSFSSSDAQQHALARWLQDILTASSRQDEAETLTAAYIPSQQHTHLRYYQQIPDFAMALLQGDTQATIHYAPLLFHLAGCAQCRADYVDIYDSLREALGTKQPPFVGQGTRTLAATPHRMLAHLSQTLITQAELLLHQTHRGPEDHSSTAREHLQLAMRISSHIHQHTLRREALHDLVRVAALFSGPQAPQTAEPEVERLTPALAGINGVRKVFRRAEVANRVGEEPAYLLLQANGFSGKLIQQGEQLVLQLEDLGSVFRGNYAIACIPLGSLIEPIRWQEGNPLHLRSEQPVSSDGSVRIPLGATDLRMQNPEERNLIEAIFLLIEMRPESAA